MIKLNYHKSESIVNIIYKESGVNNSVSLGLFFSSMLVILFMILVPIVEWPDAMDHIVRRGADETIYPFDVFSMLSNLIYPILNGHHEFFADHHIYNFSINYLLINFERLFVVLFFFLVIYILVGKIGCSFSFFCPPLIFSLAAPSQEVLGILMLLLAVISQKKSIFFSVFFSIFAIILDRSMVPNSLFIIIYSISHLFRSLVLSRRFAICFGIILLVAGKIFAPSDVFGLIGESEVTLYGFSVGDLGGLAESGGNKLVNMEEIS